MTDQNNNVIEPFGQDDPFEAVFTDSRPQIEVDSAKREALHKVICGLYDAIRKGMDIGDVLHALRDYHAESTDDFGLAIHQFDAVFWGCQG